MRRRLFFLYLRAFVMLWIAGKIANAVTAMLVRLPPLAFRPGTELAICAIELLVLAIFIRSAHEDIFLANLGIRLSAVLAPFVAVHAALSGAVALLA